MRYLLVLLLSLKLFATSYEFDEYKFVSAANTTFKQSGTISFEQNKTTITYAKPKYKEIVNDGTNITIKGSSGKVYKLKGKGLFYTKLFIDVMSKLGDFTKLKDNRDFTIDKKQTPYVVEFKGDLQDQVLKAEVVVESSKVKSFKLFMKNGDTIEIVKR